MKKTAPVAKKRTFEEAARAAKAEHRAMEPLARLRLVSELRRELFGEALGPVLPVAVKRPWKTKGSK